jgi:integrase
MATIFPRGKKGILYVEFHMGGQRFVKSLRTTDRAEAEKKAEELQKETFFEVTATPIEKMMKKGMRLRAGLDRMLAEKWGKTSTGEERKNQIERIINIIGDVYIQDINQTHLLEIKNALYDGGASPRTVNKYLTGLMTLRNRAIDIWGMPLPRMKVEKEREEPKRRKILTHEEEAELLHNLKHLKEKYRYTTYLQETIDLAYVLLGTGMRVGEAMALTWDHVNMSTSTIELTADITKSSQPRDVPFGKRVKEILQDRMDLGDPGPFTDVPYDAIHRNITRAAEHMQHRADKKPITPHCFRHTFATRMVDAGVNLYQIKTVLGHSSIKVTERYARGKNIADLRAKLT